jgi:hypothetical protein
MPYEPKPIDTSRTTLPDDLQGMIELLAENTHDTWASRRIAEGWTWGPERDDETKTHPDLVPYWDLPESEKEYDRNTAAETLKVIISLGYRIVRSV